MSNHIKDFYKNLKNITDYYNYLVNKIDNKKIIGSTNEIIIDNYYLLLEYKNEIAKNKKSIIKTLKNNTFLYDFLKDLAVKNNYNITYRVLIRELNAYQRDNNYYFNYELINNVKTLLVLVYTERLHQITKELHEINVVKENIERNINNIDSLIPFNINDYNYIYEINMAIKKNNTLAYKKFSDYLEQNNVFLADILEIEYKRKSDIDILIQNICTNLKEMSLYDNETLIKSISFCEKQLINDKTYLNMADEDKEIYRKKIEKDAKKLGKSEKEYVDGIMVQFAKDGKHIGFRIFKEKNKNIYFGLHVTIILITSILLSIIMSNYFIPNRILSFFLLLLINIFSIKTLINILENIFVKKTPIFKMNYDKKIPSDSQTMVVMPVLLKSTEDIKNAFDKLEKYYITNNSEELFFTLLGETLESDKEYLEIDNQIKEYGIDYVNKLNEKYKRNIFSFIYRKRVWNNKEKKYIGYEKRRGALFQFNKILLKEMTPKEKEKYFNTIVLDTYNIKIKYVIVVDYNISSITSLNKLISAMDHPLNRPILNEKGSKVISGYGFMQVKVVEDLISKNLYTKIFSKEKNSNLLYQNLFKTSNYGGLGIYDLDVSDECLIDRFKNDRYINTNMLEGNYLRCAYLDSVTFTKDENKNIFVDGKELIKRVTTYTEIINYIFPKVRNNKERLEKNLLTPYGKLSIFSNFLKIFYPLLLLINIILTIYLSKYKIQMSIFILISMLLFNLEYSFIKKAILKTLIDIFLLPCYAVISISSFIITLYRVLITHKKLLSINDISNKLIIYIPNIIIGIICLISKNYLGIIMGIFNILVLFLLPILNRDIKENNEKLLKREEEELENIARKTWNYFKDNLCEEYNYLIPNNYQELREEKISLKTTPTDIGFSLVSVCSASKLDFITLEEAISYINKILTTVLELKKWNGHLYNCYDIKSKKVLSSFVETTESGNFITSIIIIKNFLKDKNNELTKICEELIRNADFSKLYNKNNFLSEGFYDNLKTLSNNSNNKLLSSSRLTNLVAISKGDIPKNSWTVLEKTLPNYSSLYECMMPNLFMNVYQDTFLERAYTHIFKTQQEYIKNIDSRLPWGISDSFSAKVDKNKNYIYEESMISTYKTKNRKNSRVVLSPSSSIIFLNKYPKNVFENITKFRQLNMIFKYGFYESYDYKSKNIVRACHSKNQSIVLISITNYLKDMVIKKYFSEDLNIKSYDYLLKDKLKIKTNFDKKLINCLSYKYKKELNKDSKRKYNAVSYIPNISILSNRNYSILLDDRGNSISKVKNIKLNKFEIVNRESQGQFLYIRDIETNKVWSNTYAPINKENTDYEVTFSNSIVKYIRTDDFITTQTEIIVTRDDNAEIRKYTFNNDSDKTKILELTTYMEPIILDEDLDKNILANSSLETKIIDNNALVAIRTNEEIDKKTYLVNRLIVNNPKGNYSYCNDKEEFIGRGNTLENPNSINKDLAYKLSTNVILSIRNKIEIAPNSKTEAYFISGFGSMEQIKQILDKYSDKNLIDRAFTANSSINKLYTKVQDLTTIEINNFNTVYNYLYRDFIIPISNEKKTYLKENTLVIKDLEKYGITGKRPIILINDSESNIPFINQILKLYEYLKNKLLYVDIVIISKDNRIKNIVNNYLFRMNKENHFSNNSGNIVIINDLTEDEKTLLKVVANLIFNVRSNHSLTQLLNSYQVNVIDKFISSDIQNNMEIINKEKLSYNNTFGGFINNGREYVITDENTPVPWCNILSNKNLTSLVTNNGCGYTFYKNSNDYQITMNKKDLVSNYKSEGIKVNNLIFEPFKSIHGFGYTTFESETEDFRQTLCEFIPRDDNVKVYLFSINNKTSQEKNIDVSFFINHVLGNIPTNHILTEYMKNDNYLRLRNVCSDNYNNVTVFLSSSERINKALIDSVYEKNIQTSVTVPAFGNKEIVFYLGVSTTDLDLLTLLYKYKKINIVKEELAKVKDFWQEQTSKIEVKTKDTTLNYMLNGWYIYKSMTSRINDCKKSFKNYIQDVINLCILDSEFTKQQIISLASYQFIEGDIFKYWINNKCLRSKNNSSHLWLAFAILFYIEYSGDIDILKTPINYIEGESLTEHEQERIISYRSSDKKDTLLNHLILALDISLTTGNHGLLLINDSSSIKKEDTATSFFFILIVNKFLELNKKYHLGIDSSKYEKFIHKLSKVLNNTCYDKNYYLEGFYEDSTHNNKDLIYLNSQSLSILSNAIPRKLVDSVFSSVEDKLVSKENKVIKVLNSNIPYMKNYTYDAGLYIMALLKEKYNNTAYKYYQMFNPVNRTLDNKMTNIYKYEPYNLVDNILENGSGENIFNTTVTSLFYKIGIEDILGIKKRKDKLYIEPHLPSNFDNYEINYKYKDSIYNIKIELSNLKQIVYDGNITAATYIKLDNKKKKHTVLVFVKDESVDKKNI